MAAFRYQALDRRGQTVRGVIDAPTLRQARAQLRERGLLAHGIAPASTGPAHAAENRFRLKANTLTLLTRQWSTLLEAGIPVEKALNALSAQQNDVRVRELLLSIRNELLGGHPLHRALATHPRCFDKLYCALVAAGEQSGQLGDVMHRLADTLEARHQLRQKLIQSLIYPLLIVLIATFVIMAMMMYVVPQVVAVFQSSRQALPLLTQMLIASSHFLRQSWPILLLVGMLGSIAWQRAWRMSAFRQRTHLFLMRLPALGDLLVTLDTARLAQTLAILVSSGVPLLPSLAAGIEVAQLLPLRQALEEAEKAVREGQSLARALSDAGHFPPLFTHMVASGESSGRLGELLEKLAVSQSSEVSNRLTLTTSLLEPLLILGMGGVVLLIVLAILQPIIEINQLLH